MLEKCLFSSYSLLAGHFKVAMATSMRILHDDLSLHKFHLRRTSHTLDSTHKGNHVTFSRELLELLRWGQDYSFEREITGDESWFFCIL
jgi:hypothetical protein